MRKYKISLYTKGAECYIHKISEDQKSKLIEIDVEGTDPDSEVVSEILNVNDVFETDDIILGGYYDPKLFSIQVENEIGDVIWESGDNYKNDDPNKEFEDVKRGRARHVYQESMEVKTIMFKKVNGFPSEKSSKTLSKNNSLEKIDLHQI